VFGIPEHTYVMPMFAYLKLIYTYWYTVSDWG